MEERPGNGLVQLGVRWYWPELGRFLQEDPARQGGNRYAYAGNNPVTRTDPTGLWFRIYGDPKPFYEALDYLSGDLPMAALIYSMAVSPVGYAIYVGDYEDRGRFLGGGVWGGIASWNPCDALHWSGGDPSLGDPEGTISPALALGHELAHAAPSDYHPSDLLPWVWHRRGAPEPFAPNAEEGHAMAYERHAARSLGESIRGSYKGLPFTATGVLDRDYQAWRNRVRSTYGW